MSNTPTLNDLREHFPKAFPSQAAIYEATGLTELPLLATLQVTRGYADHDDTVTIDQPRQYTLQAQEDAYLFNLREPYWTEACDRYYGDAPDDEPNHEPEAYAPQPCPQDSPWWPYSATHYSSNLAETTFSALPEGTWFHDPLSNLDMVKTGPSHARTSPTSPLVYWFDQADRTLV